jgi:hypothetical protein
VPWQPEQFQFNAGEYASADRAQGAAISIIAQATCAMPSLVLIVHSS